MRIRPIIDSDIAAVAALMHALSDEFITHEGTPEAANNFMRENDEAGLRAFIDAGIVYHVAELDGVLVGFIAVREHKHLFHMFVDKQHHRKGIARALWAVAREAAQAGGNGGMFTVNSSNYALPVYRALGFVQTEEMQYKNGLYYNPMQLDGRHGG